jgi:hypothetical protein
MSNLIRVRTLTAHENGAMSRFAAGPNAVAGGGTVHAG